MSIGNRDILCGTIRRDIVSYIVGVHLYNAATDTKSADCATTHFPALIDVQLHRKADVDDIVEGESSVLVFHG